MDLLPLALACRRCSHRITALPGARCPTDGAFLVAASALASHPGDPLLGRPLAPELLLFDVLSDGGGFSRVYRAAQLRLAREVVVKVLRPRQAEDALGRARFLQEARVLAALGDEPRVVAVHDCGETPDGLHYLVLARAPGRPLADLLAQGPLPEAHAVALVREVLAALGAAHNRGQVHRDLKPDNVIVHGDTITLIDFGIAKALEPQEESPRTASDVTLGTPRYMAPEQLQRGGEVGPQTDLYAAGILLYELLTGHTPFEGGPAELVGAHLYQPPPTLPGPVGAVIERALAKRPAERFADAAAMARALEAPAPVVRSVALAPTVDDLDRTPRLTRPWWPWVVAGLVAVVGLGWAVWPTATPTAQDAGLVLATAHAPDATGAQHDAPPAAAPVPPDAAVVAALVPDATGPDAAVPDAAMPRPVVAEPVVAGRRPPRRAPATAPVTAAPATPPTAPPAPAPATEAPRAAPAVVSRLRAALRTCRCDDARAVLAEAVGSIDHAALRAEVERCRPKLLGQACRYEGP